MRMIGARNTSYEHVTRFKMPYPNISALDIPDMMQNEFIVEE